MSLVREKEVDHICTVGELRAALAEAPDDMPLEDAMGESVCVSFLRDEDTGDVAAEIR